jgi:sulfide:quinone oxidoreductase
VVAPEPEFTYRPLAVAEPFSGEAPAVFRVEDLIAPQGARFQLDRLAGVERADHVALLGSGEKVGYDDLVVTCGAQTGETLPGALVFTAERGESAFAALLAELEAGTVARVAFAVPAGPAWQLPLYELALMTSGHLASHGLEAELTLTTPEPEPLRMFGAAASRAVKRLLRARGIELMTGVYPVAVDDGTLTIAAGEPLLADRVVSIPRLAGRTIAGLPHDRDGFLRTNVHGEVRGAPGVYAAGDAVAFPVKQGGIASQQADAVAHTIARAAGAPAEAKPFRPILRGVLLTGDRPHYLRSELAGGRGETSTVTYEPLWWPPAKIAGRYLGPYLAERVGPAGAASLERPEGLELEIDLSRHHG